MDLQKNAIKQELLDATDTDRRPESSGGIKEPDPCLIPQEFVQREIKTDIVNIQDYLDIGETMVTERDGVTRNMTTAVEEELENTCVEKVNPAKETILADTHIYMGDLTSWNPPAEEEQYFKRIIQILDKYYPEDWRTWVVNKMSYEDIFGDEISAKDEDQLRFAIPTVDLISAFSDDPVSSVDEKRYKLTKRILVSWPLARALIYFPFSTIEKMHPRDVYNKFREVFATLKPKLISWNHASRLLKRTTCQRRHRDSASTSSFRNTKRSHSPSQTETEAKKFKICDTLTHFMAKQNQMLEKVLQQLNMIMNKLGIQTSHMNIESSDEGKAWTAPSFDSKESSGDDMTDNENDRMETEAELPLADEILVKEAIDWQKLGQKSWRNIPYAEIQKRLEASPVFTSLKVNPSLATVTPKSLPFRQFVSELEKMDLSFGVITHGLLQQRKVLQEFYHQLPRELKALIKGHLWAIDSPFTRNSADLLLYVCGKRSEVIQERRNLYNPELQSVTGLEKEPLVLPEEQFDFLPETRETEAQIPLASEILVKKGIQCQRLGQKSWRNIAYEEIQKRLEATPVFTSLKVNFLLAAVTPKPLSFRQFVSELKNMDLAFGVITNGLLQQRKAFQEFYCQTPPELEALIRKHLWAEDSQFRRISDDLLQYVCGKRSEIIEQRRSLYEPTKKRQHDLMHSIPPSPTHLFSEPQLSELIKQQGGIKKLFLEQFRIPNINKNGVSSNSHRR